MIKQVLDWVRRQLVKAPPPSPPDEPSRLKGEKLGITESAKFYTGHCPDCGTHHLLEGPHGGLSVNYYCSNMTCGSRFNEMGPFGVERISDAHPATPMNLPHRGYR